MKSCRTKNDVNNMMLSAREELGRAQAAVEHGARTSRADIVLLEHISSLTLER